MLHLCRSFISVVSSWYDEDKEFEDKLDEVVLENAKVIALTGNNAFSVKKLLSVDDLTTNYLVYSPCVYNCPDDNWLLDVELYSEEFWADLISIWMDEMGLISNPAMRKQVKNYRAYFNAKDRCLKISTQNLKNYNDTFGYEVGDHYIVDAAHLIREACGQAGSCCQIGGDEFLVAWEQKADSRPASIEKCLEKLDLLQQFQHARV